MGSFSMFAVPGGTHWSLPVQSRSRKRKRHDQALGPFSSDQPQDVPNASRDSSHSLEYTAVVTPNERSQRRLAGLPLNQDPPPYPFPHAQSLRGAEASTLNTQEEQREQGHQDLNNSNLHARTRQSLHHQHLAAMTTLLHRCMVTKDYNRAGRALGLILRNEIGGHMIDIRSEGLWGSGAEILLRQSGQGRIHDEAIKCAQGEPSRNGFERAKLFYERLMIQYPPHKTWLNAINALDSCTALFSLWIYIACQECSQMQTSFCDEQTGGIQNQDIARLSLLEAKLWEREQAKQIAEAMDIRMRETSFGDNPELIRLRAMVALWTADLVDTCSKFEDEEETLHSADNDGAIDNQSNIIERTNDVHNVPRSTSGLDEAASNRRLAEDLFLKLSKHDKSSQS